MKKSPSFKGFSASSEISSRTKSRNRKTNTIPELLLRRALWRRGMRYRLHVRELPGCPDVVFQRAMVAVFCDGDFWHGRNWRDRRTRLLRGANAAYWVQKIEANMARDQSQVRMLQALGWKVVRLWERDIKRDPDAAAAKIAKAVVARSSNNVR